MSKNEFEVEILADGRVKITSAKFDGAVHMTAERALAWLQEQLGGEVQIQRGHAHGHSHSHDHEHDHDHEKVKS